VGRRPAGTAPSGAASSENHSLNGARCLYRDGPSVVPSRITRFRRRHDSLALGGAGGCGNFDPERSRPARGARRGQGGALAIYQIEGQEGWPGASDVGCVAAPSGGCNLPIGCCAASMRQASAYRWRLAAADEEKNGTDYDSPWTYYAKAIRYDKDRTVMRVITIDIRIDNSKDRGIRQCRCATFRAFCAVASRLFWGVVDIERPRDRIRRGILSNGHGSAYLAPSM